MTDFDLDCVYLGIAVLCVIAFVLRQIHERRYIDETIRMCKELLEEELREGKDDTQDKDS